VGGLAKHDRVVILLLQGMLAEGESAGALAVQEAAGPATQRVMAVLGEDAVVGVLDLHDAAEGVVDHVTVLFGGASAVAVVDERRIIDGRGRVMRTLLVGEDRLDAKGDPDLTEPCIRAVERPALRQLRGLGGELGGGDGGVVVGLG
jgi:hypothetical protein